MYLISQTIGNLVEAYFKEKIKFSEVRLVLPGFTKTISREIHEYLISSGIDAAYLVVSSHLIHRDNNEKIILYNEAVSIRIGSFIIICEPEALPLLQDSIKSSGAPIKELAFNEVWPWNKESIDPFNWEKFIDKFTEKRDKDESLPTYVSLFNMIVDSFTGFEPGLREVILFEKVFDLAIENNFNIETIFRQIGLPKSSNIKDIKSYYQELKKVSDFSLKILSSGDFDRDNLKDNLQLLNDNGSVKYFVSSDLDLLLDSMFEFKNLPSILIFSQYLKNNQDKWDILTLDVIKHIFQMPKDKGNLKLKLVTILDRIKQTISHDNSKIILFRGEVFKVDFEYSCADLANPRIAILRANKELYSFDLDSSSNDSSITIDSSDTFFPNVKSNLKIELALFDGISRTRYSIVLNIAQLSSLRPALYLLTDQSTKFEFKNFETYNCLDEDGIELHVSGPTNVICFSINECLFHNEETDFEIGKEKIHCLEEGGLYIIPQKGQGLNPELFQDGFINIKAISKESFLNIKLLSIIDYDKGYTIWNEMINILKAKDRTQDAKNLLSSIETKSLYSKLGSKTIEQVRRGKLSIPFEQDNDAYSPVLLKLIGNNYRQLFSLDIKKLNSGLKSFKEQNPNLLPLILSSEFLICDEVKNLINSYEVARQNLFLFYNNQFDGERLDRPLYAVNHFFVPSEEAQTIKLLESYLNSYFEILNLLQIDNNFSNSEKFLLTHLDCVSILDKNDIPKSILIGPWHPINLISNICLYNHGVRLLKKLIEKRFSDNGLNKLVTILDRNEPIKWFTYFDIYSMDFKKAQCFTTNDIGWKIALCSRSEIFKKEEFQNSLSFIEYQFGLNVYFPFGGTSSSVSTFFTNYMKVYPSARKLWIELNDNYSPGQVYNEVNSELSTTSSLKSIINKLPGGIHFIFDIEALQDDKDSIKFDENNPIFFYQGKNDSIPVDLKILPPYDKINITTGDFGHVRGWNENIIFREPVYNIINGPDNMPISRIFENDRPTEQNQSSWANVFQKISSIHSSLAGQVAINIKLNLPVGELGSIWTIIPSTTIDPQIMHRSLALTYTDGALWDYKLKFDYYLNSYYIISKIPDSIIAGLAASGFFINNEKPKMVELVNRISHLGISVGQEALTSTNKFHGIIGLIGSILCFTNDKQPIFSNGKFQIGFLISVESFRSVLYPNFSEEDELFDFNANNSAKFSDLLAIQLKYNETELIISFSSIESKFSVGRIPSARLEHGKEQAKITAATFNKLIDSAKKTDGILERLALKAILLYGIRNQSHAAKEDWELIISHVLNGNIKYCESQFPQILFSTSKVISAKKSERYPGSLLQVNLDSSNWPENNFDHSILKDLFKCINENAEQRTSLPEIPSLPILDTVIKVLSPVEKLDQQSENTELTEKQLTDELPSPESKEEINPVLAIDKISLSERALIIDKLYTFLKNQKVDLQDIPIDEIKFIEAPSFYKIELRTGSKFEFSKVEAKSRELELALALPSGLKTRAYHDRGIAWLEVPKEDYQKVSISVSNYLWPKFIKTEDFKIPFGVDNNGNIISINFSSSKSPHLLIGGKTGSGKSVLLETIIRSAAHFYSEKELEIYMIDPKGNELIEFESLPHTKKQNGETAEEAIELLTIAVEEMQIRYTKFKELINTKGQAAKDIVHYNNLSDDFIPRWLIILDEYADLVEIDSDKRKQIESLMKRLSSKARAAGIHLVVATQRPSGDIINTTVRANLPGKIALAVDSSINSRIILDETGAETLSGKGDALFKGDQEGSLIRVQCALYKS